MLVLANHLCGFGARRIHEPEGHFAGIFRAQLLDRGSIAIGQSVRTKIRITTFPGEAFNGSSGFPARSMAKACALVEGVRGTADVIKAQDAALMHSTSAAQSLRNA